MLLIILALFWAALLAPVVIRRLRDGGPERSIQSFHAEHEVLSRQEYVVNPAHRLEQPDEAEPEIREPGRRSRLTVGHADAPYRSLESRSWWDEWSRDYDYDDDEPSNARESMNRYAAAYSSVPNETSVRASYRSEEHTSELQSLRH